MALHTELPIYRVAYDLLDAITDLPLGELTAACIAPHLTGAPASRNRAANSMLPDKKPTLAQRARRAERRALGLYQRRKSLRRGPWSSVIPRPGGLRATPSQVFRPVTDSSGACKWTGKMLAAQGHIASPRLKLSRGRSIHVGVPQVHLTP